MDWILHVPVHLPGFPGLTWAVIYWLALSLMGVMFKISNLWRGWVQLERAHDDQGEAGLYLVAVFDFLGQCVMTFVVATALVVGLVSATIVPISHHLTRQGQWFLLSLEALLTAVWAHALFAWLGWTLARRAAIEGVDANGGREARRPPS